MRRFLMFRRNSAPVRRFRKFAAETKQTVSIQEGCIIAAELGVISTDQEGMYDFEIKLSDCIPEGLELVYISNFDVLYEEITLQNFLMT